MSFGGAVSAMITSLKNNKRTRISKFDKIKNNNTKSTIKVYFENKATSEDLLKIKERIKLENRRSFIRNLILLVFIIAIFIYVIGFVKF